MVTPTWLNAQCATFHAMQWRLCLARCASRQEPSTCLQNQGCCREQNLQQWTVPGLPSPCLYPGGDFKLQIFLVRLPHLQEETQQFQSRWENAPSDGIQLANLWKQAPTDPVSILTSILSSVEGSTMCTMHFGTWNNFYYLAVGIELLVSHWNCLGSLIVCCPQLTYAPSPVIWLPPCGFSPWNS